MRWSKPCRKKPAPDPGTLRLFRLAALAAVLLLCLPGMGAAQDTAGYPQDISRRLLVLYDSGMGQTFSRNNLFYDGLDMVCQYYGLLPEYRDVALRPLPDDNAMRAYRAVVTVFESSGVSGVDDYLRWLIRQLDSGRKVLVFNRLGRQNLDGSPGDPALIAEAYARLGLRYDPNTMANRARLTYTYRSPEYTGFERPYPFLPPGDYARLTPTGPQTKVCLSVKEKGREETESAPITISPSGGFALSGFLYWMDPVTFKKQWYLNPFTFVRDALELKNTPVPDPTTLSGTRVAFSHVDGDGFMGFTHIDTKKVCAEIIIEEIFENYFFPVTASVIAGEINPDKFGSPEAVDLARRIYRLPNIEPASHSYTHPFFWDQTRKEEHLETFAIAGAYMAPDYKFDPELEIIDSCEYISLELCPPDKPCRVLFWSGSCDPTPAQIEMCDKAGILNMNGGDTVFDQVRDSTFTVSPLYRDVGGRQQIYTGQANENILTGLWEGPFWGYRNIIETMKRTESPRRLKPIDIYYHFYSSAKESSLRALKDVYAWVVAQPTVAVFTSEYIRMVRDFIATRLTQAAPDVYTVENYGSCTTVRFAPDSPQPDLAACRNVTGYVALPQGLYVHLDGDADRATIKIGGSKRPEQLPYVKTAAGRISGMARENGGVRFRFTTFSLGGVTLAGLAPEAKYAVSGSAGEMPFTAVTNEHGELTLEQLNSGNVEIKRI